MAVLKEAVPAELAAGSADNERRLEQDAAEEAYQKQVGTAFASFISPTFPMATAVRFCCRDESWNSIPEAQTVVAGHDELWEAYGPADKVSATIEAYAREIVNPHQGGSPRQFSTT